MQCHQACAHSADAPFFTRKEGILVNEGGERKTGMGLDASIVCVDERVLQRTTRVLFHELFHEWLCRPKIWLSECAFLSYPPRLADANLHKCRPVSDRYLEDDGIKRAFVGK